MTDSHKQLAWWAAWWPERSNHGQRIEKQCTVSAYHTHIAERQGCASCRREILSDGGWTLFVQVETNKHMQELPAAIQSGTRTLHWLVSHQCLHVCVDETKRRAQQACISTLVDSIVSLGRTIFNTWYFMSSEKPFTTHLHRKKGWTIKNDKTQQKLKT